ncbi:hypothetical protein Bca101_069069 [Brassica carinata]
MKNIRSIFRRPPNLSLKKFNITGLAEKGTLPCVSVLIVSTNTVSPNLLIATVFHVTLLVATASPSHLLITAQPLKANRSTRSTHFVCGLVGSAHILVLTESPLDTRPKPPLFRPFPSPVIVKVARQVPSPPKRLVSPPTPNLEPLDENLPRGFQFDRSFDRNNHIVVVGVLSLGFVESYEFRYGNSGTQFLSLFPALVPSWNSVKSIYSPPPRHLSPPTPHLCFAFPFNYRSSSTARFTPPLRSSSPYQLLVPNPHKSLDMSFQSVTMELRFSSSLDESHGSRNGNIGVHLLSWISVRSPSCLIVKSIASHQPRRLATPIPSESRWYTTDTCFGLNQNHLRSLNVLVIIYLSHQSSSEASCLSMVRRRASVQRVHLAQSRDVELKSPLLVHSSQVSRVSFSSEFVTGAIRVQGPAYLFVSSKSRTLLLFVSDEIHVVSSGNIEVGVRAVHSRSTSFQTWQFGLINVACDYFMLVVVAYSGKHPLLPTVLHLSSKTLLLALLSLGLVFVFMLFFRPSRTPPVVILLPLSIAPDVIV